MVPKLHPKGSSFKGAAAYLLHDKDRAETNDRVDWTETRNLAVSNPETAWKIMAATASDQDRLKEQAGVKNTGRKSNKCALHFSLSWHPEQTPSRDDMLDAVDGALDALGATGHQALIVAHNDEAHPHVHVLLNRVSPEDGRHLSSSKEKLNLSKWAQEYEERTGIYCENRILNNEMRGAGEYIRGTKDQARHLYEEQAHLAANDNANLRDVIKAQKAKDHALALRGRNLAKLQAQAKAKLDVAHRERKEVIASATAKRIEAARKAIIEKMRPDRIALRKAQAREAETFAAMEKSFFGRAGNVIKTVAASSRDVREGESNIIKRTFGIVTNAAARKEYFEASQLRARQAQDKEQRDRIDAAKSAEQDKQSAKVAQLRKAYAEDRKALQGRQEAENKVLKDDWAKRGAERREALEKASQLAKMKDQAARSFNKESDDPAMRTARAIERNTERMKAFDRARAKMSREQDNDRAKDRDDDRER